MAFVGVTWLWTVALILAWPPEKTSAWEPEFRLVATCADKEGCGVPFAELEQARTTGKVLTLRPPEPHGDIGEVGGWLKWRTSEGTPWTYEVTSSSWNYQVAVRYRLEGEVPVLFEVQRITSIIFFYAMGLAVFTLTGIYLRGLRNR